MSTNLATILVGLGYDLSALEKGAPEAFRLINQQTLGMSAEMKRASREGAESLRLIDEALGIHLSRPLTRILTQEFPGLAKGLQAVLGAGVVGAVGAVGYEIFAHIGEAIEKARKAQEALQEATQKTKDVFSDAMGSIAKDEKSLSLTGLDKKVFEIDYSSVERAKKSIDELSASFKEMIKAEQEARGGFLIRGANEIGLTPDVLHKLYTTPTELATEKLGKQFGEFQKRFDELSKSDALKGTHESASFVNQQLAIANDKLKEMESHRMGGFLTFFRNQIPITQTGQFGFSQAEIDRMQQFVTLLKESSELLAGNTKLQKDRDDEARKADAKEKLKKEVAAIQAADGATQKWAESLKKAFESALPPKDQYSVLDAEINKSVISLTNLQHRIGPISFRLLFDGKSLSEVEREMSEFFGSKITAPAIKLPSPPLPATLPTAAVTPALGSGGTAAAQFDVFAGDKAAQLKAAAQAYQLLITPEQQYQEKQRELNLLLSEGLIDHAAYTAAMQKAREEFDKSERSMVKARDGLKSFLAELKEQGNTAQFTYDMLNKGLQGFEDETVKALTGAKTSWSSFFLELDQMAMKFFLNKMFSSLLSGGAGGGFGSLFGSLFGGGAAAGAAVGGGWGDVSAVLADVGIMGFASGTDSAPGGLAWVGENGPELMNVPAGSSITPTSALRMGHSVSVAIDARGAQMGVAEQIAKSWERYGPALVMRAVVEASEVQRRTPH